MKIFLNQKQFFAFFYMLFIVCCFTSGCKPYGPVLPLDSINETFSEELRVVLPELYKRSPQDVFDSICQLKQMKEDASRAVPYLASMLTDRRLAKKRVYGFVKPAPLFKEIAITLGTIGEEGVFALVDSLKETSQVKGHDDDFIREAVAEGLKTAKEQWGELPFRKMRNTKRVLHIIDAVSACLSLESEPDLFDENDPRKNLKFYKHFSETATREGLRIYIETLGFTGDERALAILSKIVPLSKKSLNTVKVQSFCQFQRASSIAQYKIRPIVLSDINPVLARMLFVEFVSKGDLARVNKMLEEGIDPDTKTFIGELVISLAFKKKHIDIFSRLVEKGATIDYRLSKNDTPLIRAAVAGDYEFVKALIKNGANPSLSNNSKQTAIAASLNQLLEFWDRKSTDKKAEPYLKIISLLRDSGSPPVPQKQIKSLDKKALKILGL